MLINKREGVEIKHFNDSEAFIEYSNDMDNIYENTEEYNPYKRREIMIIFDDMIADVLSYKNLNPTIKKLFIIGRKLNISLAFITQSYFVVRKIIILNSTHYFIMKIPKKWELQQIAFNHSSDIDFQDVMNLYRKYNTKPYSFLMIDTAFASDSCSHFRKNILERI